LGGAIDANPVFEGLEAEILRRYRCGCAIAPAFVVPPTVTPSPGYNARLAEQRRATEVQAPAHARKPAAAIVCATSSV
jgi:hypothetical protein